MFIIIFNRWQVWIMERYGKIILEFMLMIVGQGYQPMRRTLLSTFGPLVISNTLYYAAMGGQTVFYLSYPDKFGHTGVLADHNVLVYEGGGLGNILMTYYTVSVGANTGTLPYNPLSAGEIAVFDIVNPPPPAPVIPPPILLNSGVIGTTLVLHGFGRSDGVSAWDT